MADQRIFKIVFYNQGEIYEIYAESVSQGSLFGFVEIEGLLFGERSQVVVDPSEERMKSEFKGVQRIHLPMHAVVRIDEVEKQGTPRVTKNSTSGSNVASFPGPIYTPRPPRGSSGES